MHARVSLRKPLRCGFAVVLCSCLFYGAMQCRAQESTAQQQTQQDVADAARQERARREQEKAPPHVYTDEDLKRLKILTPEDEARLAAARKLLPTALPEQQPDLLDAETSLSQLPLGDIARLYRSARRATEPAFHFPVEEPVLASPMFPVEPGTIAPSSVPHVPLNVAPSWPTLTPAHPKLAVAPHMPSSAPVRRVDPFTRRLAPQRPISTIKPAAPAAAPSMKSAVPSLSSVKPATSYVKPATPNPVAPTAATGASPAVDYRVVTVQSGDSLWKIAEQALGHGSRWHELLSANPSIANPNALEVGTQIRVPEDIRAPHVSKVMVQAGDTLTKIALAQYGRASNWRCIAEANPTLTDANRIYEGEELVLPPTCKP